jgi:hypothetical protein
MKTETLKVLLFISINIASSYHSVFRRFISARSSAQNMQQYIFHGQKISSAHFSIKLSIFLIEYGIGYLGREH